MDKNICKRFLICKLYKEYILFIYLKYYLFKLNINMKDFFMINIQRECLL